jgi:predicted PurR-regulated permease PerM
MGDSAADRDFLARTARHAVVGGVVLVVVLALLRVLEAALTPLVAAFVIAYLLDPLIDRFERRGVSRSIAIFLLLFLLGGALFATVVVVLPTLQREVVALGDRLPGYFERLVTTVIPEIESRLAIQLPHTLDEVIARVRSGEIPLPFEPVRAMLTKALGTVFGTFTSLIGLLVIPILAFYLLVEFDHLTARLARWIPPMQRGYIVEKAGMVDRLISGFLRGQLLVAAALGVLYAIGFSVIGIDLALGVGLLGGVLSLVPYLGGAVAFAMASLLAILEFGIGWQLGAVIAWYTVVQTIESFVLTPRIVGQSVGLHPAVVIVALLIGGDLFGFLGLLVAVPAAAVVKVFAGELFELYRGSALFDEDRATVAAAAPEPGPTELPPTV